MQKARLDYSVFTKHVLNVDGYEEWYGVSLLLLLREVMQVGNVYLAAVNASSGWRLRGSVRKFLEVCCFKKLKAVGKQAVDWTVKGLSQLPPAHAAKTTVFVSTPLFHFH